MKPVNHVSGTFLDEMRRAVDENLTNDQFSVEELAKIIGMSRSQLHRKLSFATGQSVSQFIREYRLQRAMALLKEGRLTAAQVSDQTGFGSPTYFNKCFNDYYGFPPGEAKKMVEDPASGAAVNPNGQLSPRTAHASIFLKLTAAFAVLLLLAGTYYYQFYRPGETLSAPEKSIAILPFKNLSQDQRNEYFSDGVIEAIRTNLSHVRDLRVISRTSVEQYRRTEKSAREIARELGVAALLEGSVQRVNNKVRIDVQLVDGSTGEQVWAQSYDRELADVFSIQTEIAQRVVNELNATLSAEEKTRLSKTETNNPRAYDLYLKGIYEYRTYTNKGAHAAIELLSEAIALDPNYARAYAFLANSYIGLATVWGAELSAREVFEKGKPLLDKALALNPELEEAHMLMGFCKLYNDWDFKGAEKEYRLAIASDHPDALAMYADYLNFVGRHKEAMAYAERLNEKEPYYPNSRIVYSYIYNGRLDDALSFSESRLKLFSNYNTMDAHGFLLLNMKRYNEAILYFNKAMALEGIRYPRMLAWMGAAYARSGKQSKAREIIDELKGRLAKKEKGSIAFFIAVVYSALDEKQSALAWLKTAFDSHDMEMPWLLTEPQLYSLHAEPEFRKLVKAVGFN